MLRDCGYKHITQACALVDTPTTNSVELLLNINKRLSFTYLKIFLRAVFSASSAQHVAELHSTFTLRPHHVWKYGRHPISDR